MMFDTELSLLDELIVYDQSKQLSGSGYNEIRPPFRLPRQEIDRLSIRASIEEWYPVLQDLPEKVERAAQGLREIRSKYLDNPLPVKLHNLEDHWDIKSICNLDMLLRILGPIYGRSERCRLDYLDSHRNDVLSAIENGVILRINDSLLYVLPMDSVILGPDSIHSGGVDLFTYVADELEFQLNQLTKKWPRDIEPIPFKVPK